MNNPAISIGHNTPSGISIPPPDQPQPIRYWQQKFERYLQQMGRKATREPYARALERFLAKHPGKMYPHDFLRPTINDYVQTRFAEGASVANLPDGVLRSRLSFKDTNTIPSASKSANETTTCLTERPNRSSFQTATTSSLRCFASFMSLLRAGRLSLAPETP
jgi:hypothetical protein